MLKKLICTCLAIALLFGLFSGIAFAAAPTFVSVILDGTKIPFPDRQPYINEDARTLVPIRFVAEGMGAKVEWTDKTKTVLIQKGDQTIRLTIDENRALVNGLEKTFDTKTIMSGGRTFVPLRFISDILSANVKWDGPTLTVYIQTSEYRDTAAYDSWGRLIRTTDLPKNAKDYSYILADVPNEMYEMKYPFSHPDPTQRKVSAEMYANWPEFKKENIDIWMGRLKTFGALWLNADYRTIDYTWAKELADLQSTGSLGNLKNAKQYVDWVKENKIDMEGYLDPEPSMIYQDGFGNYYVRSKFRVKFKNFRRNEKVLYDLWFPKDIEFEKDIWYEGYTDVALSTNVGGNWGKTLKVNGNASLFSNHIIRKAD
jgi:hypothetical protein